MLLLQILQLSQHDKAITVYYHPNSFSSTQSIRSNLASCWRFTVALDTPEVRQSQHATQDCHCVGVHSACLPHRQAELSASVVLCAITKQAWLASSQLFCAVTYDEPEDDHPTC